ncbi:hypothetical protein GCM10022222_64100 [Amycolatopsis ultiminotia]|uniref:FAD linked oxidase N-terminal domain-containing protein n=1 Tax=Amycolatopsis ultiminotia TaxID=543629 RepID=A0ABP6XRM5_9PSEU
MAEIRPAEELLSALRRPGWRARRTPRAVGETGMVPDDLQSAAREHGLLFGPDPSTHSRCTIGGMIGNKACGSHSVAWGRTSDNVLELEVLTYQGTVLTAGEMTGAQIRTAVDAAS